MSRLARTAVGHLAWAIGGRIAITVASLATVGMVAAAVGSESLGEILLLVTLGNWVALGAQAGLHNVALNPDSGSVDHARRPVFVSSALAATTLMGIAAALLLALPVLREAIGEIGGISISLGAGILVAVFALGRAWQGVLGETRRANGDIRGATLLNARGALFGGLAGSGLVVAGVGAHSFLGLTSPVRVFAFVAAIQVAVGLVAVLRDVGAAGLVRGMRGATSALKRGRQLALSSIFLNVRQTGDLWIVAAVAPASEVGRYGVAARLALVASMPLMILNAVLPSRLGHARANGRNGDAEAIIRSAATSALTAGVLGGLLVVAAGNVAPNLLGDDFTGLTGLTLVLIAGHLANAAFGPSFTAMVVWGEDAALTGIWGLGLAVMIGTAAMLGSLWGPVGVATGVAMGTAAENLLAYRVLRHRHQTSALPTVRPSVLASGLRAFLSTGQVDGNSDRVEATA